MTLAVAQRGVVFFRAQVCAVRAVNHLIHSQLIPGQLNKRTAKTIGRQTRSSQWQTGKLILTHPPGPQQHIRIRRRRQ